MFDKYVFIYKNSLGIFNIATNPRFIASHTACRAIERHLIGNYYDFMSDFVDELNSLELSDKAKDIIYSSDLQEIY